MSKVFISHVSENGEKVCTLKQELEQYGIQVWWADTDIKPGALWKPEIQKAIRDGDFFIACFSEEYYLRDKNFMNEELNVAIEELRLRHENQSWFIPVKLNECEIPDMKINLGKTLRDFQFVPLYKDWTDGIRRIIEVIPPGSPDGEELNRDDYVGYNNRGLDYLARGEYDRAIESLSTAIQLKSNYVLAHQNLGHVYQRIGEYGRALRSFAKALRLDPNNANTVRFISNVSYLDEHGLYPEDVGNPRNS